MANPTDSTTAAPTKTKRLLKNRYIDRTPSQYTGPTKIDISVLAPILIDLPPGAMQGLRPDVPNIDEVVTELAAQVPLHGAEVGIPDAVYKSFVDHTSKIDQIKAEGAVVLKLAEVIVETLAQHVDARDQLLGQIVDAIRSAMKRMKNAGIGAPFQKSLAARATVANKAVATRKKKAAAKAPAASTTTK